MPAKRGIRSPQQKRSRDKKEKILAAAYTLFCQKGYHATTTPKVARKAGVSIGCLYSYFKDKHDLFLEVVDRYMDNFTAIRAQAMAAFESTGVQIRPTLRAFMLSLIEMHETSKELNREMKVLYHSDPAIAARMDAQQEKIQAAIKAYIVGHRGSLRVADPEAATIVVDELFDGLVERIVFDEVPIGRQRIIDAGVDALCAYLAHES